MKLLATQYKTFDGASRRAQFENAMARSDFARGRKAKLYRYRVVRLGHAPDYRVERLPALERAP